MSTSAPTQIIAVDGVTFVEETASDAAITAELSLDSIADLLTYLIETNDLAIAGAGPVWETPTSHYDYIRSKAAINSRAKTYITIGSVVVSVLIKLLYLSQSLKWGTQNVFMAGVLNWSQGLKHLGSNMMVGANAADDSIKVTAGFFVAKYATRIAYAFKILGVIVSLALLAYEIYTIWDTRGKFSSPYDYDEEYATSYAVTATVVAVVFFLLAFTPIGLLFLVVFSLVTLIAYFLIKEFFGQKVDFMGGLINSITSLVVSYTPYTELADIDFAGLEVAVNGSLVKGSTLTLSDEFTGIILRSHGGGNSQLDKSDSYAWFEADASGNTTVTTRRGDSDCDNTHYLIYDYKTHMYYSYGWGQYCDNDLEADFTFSRAGINQTVKLFYKMQVNTRYEKCNAAGTICDKKTDRMTLPNELRKNDRWDWVEMQVDVLPDSVDGLWTWSALSNRDRDGDGLRNREENALGTDADAWDTDGDGLSDGFEAGVQAEAGTDPTAYDSDGDGLNDGLEYQLGSTINDADSDDDGLTDGEEVFHWDGSKWTGGGWMVSIDGSDYWVFSSPLNDDADRDLLNDASEKNAGSSPNAANDAPSLTLTAGPTLVSPTGARAVYVAAGDTVTA
ncbi:MAG: hypothetical protein V3R81_06105, partial [Gammaproteobacteria bacterium]